MNITEEKRKFKYFTVTDKIGTKAVVIEIAFNEYLVKNQGGYGMVCWNEVCNHTIEETYEKAMELHPHLAKY